jgi:hypothetical protein
MTTLAFLHEGQTTEKQDSNDTPELIDQETVQWDLRARRKIAFLGQAACLHSLAQRAGPVLMP